MSASSHVGVEIRIKWRKHAGRRSDVQRFVGPTSGSDRYVHTSLDMCVYLHSTSKQKSEQGGHFSLTKVTFPNAGKLLPGQLRLDWRI